MGSPDVVVIGAGVIGAACAYELALSGRDVLVIERGRGWATECSRGNAGLICPSHSSPLASPENLWFGIRSLGRPTSALRVVPQRGLLPWMFRFLAACMPSRSARNEALLLRLG